MLATLPDIPDSVTNTKATDKTKGAYNHELHYHEKPRF